jgi:uncharacterized protein with FMN-binding domain
MNNTNNEKGGAKLIPIIAVVATIIAGGGGYMFYTKDSVTAPEVYEKDATAKNSPPLPPPVVRSAGITVASRTESTSTDSTTSSYKDGTWKAEGAYAIPEDGETEKIGVSLTLKDGIIVESTVTDMAIDNDSVKYQGDFIKNYKQYVIGKNIDEVVVGKVSRSSLTSKGFMSALEKIKLESKS